MRRDQRGEAGWDGSGLGRAASESDGTGQDVTPFHTVSSDRIPLAILSTRMAVDEHFGHFISVARLRNTHGTRCKRPKLCAAQPAETHMCAWPLFAPPSTGVSGDSCVTRMALCPGTTFTYIWGGAWACHDHIVIVDIEVASRGRGYRIQRVPRGCGPERECHLCAGACALQRPWDHREK